jgi:hypothetical protein
MLRQVINGAGEMKVELEIRSGRSNQVMGVMEIRTNAYTFDGYDVVDAKGVKVWSGRLVDGPNPPYVSMISEDGKQVLWNISGGM